MLTVRTFHPYRYIAYNTKIVGNASCAMLPRKLTTASPLNSRCDRSNVNEPTGFARRQLKASRRLRGKDSGSTKNPYSQLSRLNPAATQNGSLGSMLPNTPPTAGPRTKPKPNAAFNIPNPPARFSGRATSSMYALADEKLAKVMPEITRPTNNHPT